eukprot:jgi/Orpsp1_1/1180483/evm.model.c7180000073588.1
MIWHRRLGHFYNTNIIKYLNLHNVKEPLCLDCRISKKKRTSHKGETPKAKQVLETIHSDIIGPINTSITGKRFILITMLKKYNNKSITTYCKNNGIIKIYSPPYNPENNGLVERFNQTIVSCAKTLLFWSKLSVNFWDFAVQYVTYLYNLVPHSSINNKIPNELFYNKKVNIKHIKVFGCITYYKNYNQNKTKLEPNPIKGIFLGFDERTYAYIIMDYQNYKLHRTVDIECVENEPANLSLSNNALTENDREYFFNYDFTNFKSANNNRTKLYIDCINNRIKNNNDDYELYELNNMFNKLMTMKNLISTSQNYSKLGNTSKSLDIKNTNTNHTNKEVSISNYKLIHNIKDFNNKQKFNTNNEYNNKNPIDIKTTDPLSYEEAISCPKSPYWKSAMDNEIMNLYDNHTFIYTKYVPSDGSIVPNGWVYTVKKDSDGRPIKYKARLVAKGYAQKYGLNYDKTYSPTLSIDGVKLIIALASMYNWDIQQLDIKAAYLNAYLDKPIYTPVPRGDRNFGKGYWLLKKALYGLK